MNTYIFSDLLVQVSIIYVWLNLHENFFLVSSSLKQGKKENSCGMPLVLLVSYFGPNPGKAGIFECEALTKNASVSIAEPQMFRSKAPIGTFSLFYLGIILWAIRPNLLCALNTGTTLSCQF